MPISYAMNSCAATWVPPDSRDPRPSPPLQFAQVARPADTILICESQLGHADLFPLWLWENCPFVFAHPAGKVGNFIFYDGHVKSKKWLNTLYPVNENNRELTPNPDSSNRTLTGPSGCDNGDSTGHLLVPPGPGAKEFQTKECLAYQ